MKVKGRRPRVEGFTLLELLVVVAIISVLAGIVSYAASHGIESARATNCAGHLRQLGIALSGYLGDHNNLMPELKAGRETKGDDVPVIDNTLDKYMPSKSVFACPSDHQYAAASGTSYYWNTALNGQSAAALNFLKVIDTHGHIPVLADKAGFHPYEKDKVNILYADGHASKDVSFFTGN